MMKGLIYVSIIWHTIILISLDLTEFTNKTDLVCLNFFFFFFTLAMFPSSSSPKETHWFFRGVTSV